MNVSDVIEGVKMNFLYCYEDFYDTRAFFKNVNVIRVLGGGL